jgi:HK97 family phage portal protein
MPRNSFRRRASRSAAPGLDPNVRFNGSSPVWWQTYESSAPAVTDSSVLGLPGAFRAVTLLAHTVAGLPLQAFRGDAQVTTPPLLERPNSYEIRRTTIERIVTSLLMRGNCFLYLGGWDAAMRPTTFEVVNPDAVSVDTTSGEPLYRIGSMEPLTRYEVVHLRYLSFGGSVMGVGPVEAARSGLQGVLALDQYGRSAWTSNGVPSAVITVEDPTLSPEMAEEIKARWVANTTGPTRTPTVLPATMTAKEIAWTPQDAEYLASKVQSLTDLALIFGVPVGRLGGDGPRNTYSNLTADEASFARYSISPLTSMIEGPLSDLLPRGTVARFNLDALLRGTTEERYRAHKLGIDGGWLTPNEVRALEGREPLPGGDDLPMPKPSTPPQAEAPDDAAPEEDAA